MDRPVVATDSTGVASDGFQLPAKYGPATVTARLPGLSAPPVTFTAQSGPARFVSAVTRDSETCALTTSGVPYCWGSFAKPSLMFGSSVPTGPVLTPTAVRTSLRFQALTIGHYLNCGIATNGSFYCWPGGQWWLPDSLGANGPVKLSGGAFDLAPYSGLSAGEDVACMLSAGGRASCLGEDATGAAAASGQDQLDAVNVMGTSLRFSQVSMGHIALGCGIAIGGGAYCWGGASDPMVLGDSTGSPCRWVPTMTCVTGFIPIQTPVKLQQISVGIWTACGIGTDSAIYCWGEDGYGQGGDSTLTGSYTAKRADLDVPVQAISMSDLGGCALSGGGAVYCWGGAGDTYGVPTRACLDAADGLIVSCTPVPEPVNTSLRFTNITVGPYNVCGVATVYCWGDNAGGQLGNGSTAGSATPTMVSGQHD